MNFLQQIASMIEPEQEKLRKAYAFGDPLPYRGKPGWLLRQRPTALGFYRLPLAADTDDPGGNEGTSVLIGLLCCFGALLLWNQITLPVAIGLPLFGGLACFAGAWIAWNSYATFRRFAPEAASLQLRPGDPVLLMLKPHAGLPKSIKARLLYRERWYVDAGKQSEWKQTIIQSMPIDFVRSGPSLMTSHLELPDDLPPSYDAGKYRLEWVVTIERLPWWGLTHTSYYVLWIAP